MGGDGGEATLRKCAKVDGEGRHELRAENDAGSADGGRGGRGLERRREAGAAATASAAPATTTERPAARDFGAARVSLNTGRKLPLGATTSTRSRAARAPVATPATPTVAAATPMPAHTPLPKPRPTAAPAAAASWAAKSARWSRACERRGTHAPPRTRSRRMRSACAAAARPHATPAAAALHAVAEHPANARAMATHGATVGRQSRSASSAAAAASPRAEGTPRKAAATTGAAGTLAAVRARGSSAAAAEWTAAARTSGTRPALRRAACRATRALRGRQRPPA